MRGQRLYEIQVRYGLPVGRGKAKPEQVRDDLAAVLSLLEDPPQSGPPFREDGPAALAMTAVQMHAQGGLALSSEELWLAISLLMSSVEARSSLENVEDVSFYSSGADRSAGRALPWCSALRLIGVRSRQRTGAKCMMQPGRPWVISHAAR